MTAPSITLPTRYVNFERPLMPSPVGFDDLDQKLDLVVPLDGEPDLDDEDELDAAVRAGMFSAAEADEVRAEANCVLAQPVWPTGWEEWRPDPSWPVPQLVPGWDRV